MPALDWEERRAGTAIEHEDVAVLGDLRDGLDRAAVAPDSHQGRRGGKVAVPDIVLDALEVPDALAGARVEREHVLANRLSPWRLAP